MMKLKIFHLLITSACQDNSLSISHTLFDKYLLTRLFRNSFLALAFFTSVELISVVNNGREWIT
jgi:hypothetical protein